MRGDQQRIMMIGVIVPELSNYFGFFSPKTTFANVITKLVSTIWVAQHGMFTPSPMHTGVIGAE